MIITRALYLPMSIILGGFFYDSISHKCQDNILKTTTRNSDAPHHFKPFKSNLILAKKWQENIFKVNAINSNPVNDFNDYFDGDPLRVVGAKDPMPTNALIMYDQVIETKSYISYNDYAVICDTSKKTPYVIMQGITKDTVDNVKHRHCEALQIGIQDKSKDYYFGNEGCEEKLIISHIEPATVRWENDNCVCDHCNKCNFWHVFHRYVKFLTGMYAEVYVCSGPLFLTSRTSEEKPSHYFKIIFCKNGSGSYRFECYMIDNVPLKGLKPDLRDWAVSRAMLQKTAGLIFFPKVPNRMIKQRYADPGFYPPVSSAVWSRPERRIEKSRVQTLGTTTVNPCLYWAR